jgi:hypothetical protein
MSSIGGVPNTRRQVVRLTIEVPDGVDVHTMIVRKSGANALAASSPATRFAKVDLTTQKAQQWLNNMAPRAADCCCVRG